MKVSMSSNVTPVFCWVRSGDLTKTAIEVGYGLESARIGGFGNGLIGFKQEPFGMSHADIIDKVGQRAAGDPFEIMAEGGMAHAHAAGDFVMIQRLGEMFEDVIIGAIDALTGELIQMRSKPGTGKERKILWCEQQFE